MQGDWGWAGTVGEFLGAPVESWMRSLDDHHALLMGYRSSSSQRRAWGAEHATLAMALRDCCVAAPAAENWGIVFEYELPLEGGRRPDVVVLAGSAVAVLEFKDVAAPQQSYVDQVAAYASDLMEYHAATHGRAVAALVVLTGTDDVARIDGDVVTTSPAGLARYLFDAHEPGEVELDTWLRSPYRPLPTLVVAAKRIFDHEPLPHVRRAEAVGIPETVDLLGRLITDAERAGARILALVTGVPGAGKTLVGLRLVYERSDSVATATFLSGNGPLVQVLRDALRSGVFVRDLHAFIRTYGDGLRVPDQHVLVFDEAQRAWDRAYMMEKRRVDRSEPQLLVGIGERLPSWAALVGLVGGGQEIHSGEESGMGQWAEAARPPSASAACACTARLGSPPSSTASRSRPIRSSTSRSASDPAEPRRSTTGWHTCSLGP